MRAKKINLVTFVPAVLIFFSCTKTTETYQTDPLSVYVPLQVGKYITYRLDSTVFTAFGSTTEVHSYLEKQVVDAQITDASGRPSYRIIRYLKDTADTSAWASAGTYFITPTTNTIEVIENNLRFIKLTLPVKQNNTWKGNLYLPSSAFSSMYTFNNDSRMEDWNYTYTSVNGTDSINGKSYNGVLSVNAIDEFFNSNSASTTVINPAGIAYVNYMQDKYAKNIGLIYQQFMMWEYQPPSSTPFGSKTGFGVKRSIIDHN